MDENRVVDETYINVSLNTTRISSHEGVNTCLEEQDSRNVQKYERNAFLTGWSLLTISQRDGYLFLLADLSSDRKLRVLNESLPKEELQHVAEGVRLLEDAGYIQFVDYKWVDPHLVLCIHKTI